MSAPALPPQASPAAAAAAGVLPLPRRPDAPAAAGLDLACRLGPGAALLLGWHEGRLPRDAEALLDGHAGGEGPEARARFRAVAWPREDGPGIWFLAALRAAPGPGLRPGATLALAVAGRTLPLGPLPGEAAGPEALVAALRGRLPPGRAGAVARFLFDAVSPAAAARPGTARAALSAILQAVSLPEGAVEIAGGGPGACGFLQGWGLPAGDAAELVLRGVDGALVRLPAREAAFARPDIAAPAAGLVHLLAAPGLPPGPLAEIYAVAADGGLVRRPVVAGRPPLDAAGTAGHLRDMLPLLRGDAETMALARSALRPRYQGVDTVWSGPRPVRAAVDLLADAGGAGLYLQGWLFDPQALVRAAWLRGDRGYAARLDPAWTRIARPDVGAGLAGDPRLAPFRDAPSEHGFAVALPPVPAGEALHLDLDFDANDCAFLPLAAPARDPLALRRALAGVDLHQPSGEAVVERQLGPLVLRRLDAPPPLPEAVRLPDLGPAGPAEAVSLLVPMADPEAGVPAFLSQFLADPPAPDERLVFALSGRWGAGAVAALRRRLAFQGLAAALVRTDAATADAAALLDLAAGAARGTLLLCLAPSVFGRTPGWRAALRAAGTEPAVGPAALLPVLVYEDFAVRSAGVAALRVLEAAPYAEIAHLGAGLPVSAPRPHAAPPPRAGGLECCLLPAAARAEAGGFAGGHLLAPARAFDFFARAGTRAGLACRSVPAAEVYALEEAAAPEPWERAALLADGWALRARHAATGPEA